MRYLLVAALLAAFVACGDDKPTAPRGPQAVALRSPTAPENLIYNLQVLYNDTVRSKADRVAAFADLLAPDFIFHFQPTDYDSAGGESWGRAEEICAHEGIFGAPIYSLRLEITHDPAQDVADTLRPGWKSISTTNVYLRLLVSPDDGFLVRSQAEFIFVPAGERWFIAEWIELPSLAALRLAVEPNSWGRIKAVYRPDSCVSSAAAAP